jgi:hypothetical protein
MIHKLLAIGSAAAVLVAVGTASAQTTMPVDLPMVGFEAGGGVLGYLDGEIPVGPAWQARIRAIVVPQLSIDTTYLGSVSNRTDNGESMVSTQVDGSLRVTPLAGYILPLQTYGAVGVGYAHFSGDDGDDTAVVVPMTVGAEAPLGTFLKAGASVSIRPVFLEDLRTPSDVDAGRKGPGGDSWSAIAHLGGEF